LPHPDPPVHLITTLERDIPLRQNAPLGEPNRLHARFSGRHEPERETDMDWKSTREGPDDWHLTDDLRAEHGKGDPFAAAIRATRMSMLITDPRQADNPIVFANDSFLRLTGYDRDEVVGSNCRFLQGPNTDPEAIARLRTAIAERKDISIDILNYRKDGSQFWNALYISPVVNEAGELQFYFASQLDVTDRKDSEHRVRADKERFEQAVKDRTAQLQSALEAQKTLLHEVDHRVKNNLQMISSLIVMQSRTIPDPAIRESLRSMLERVEALSTVHRRLYQSDDVTRFDVADFVRDLVSDVLAASGRSDIAMNLDLEPVEIKAERAAPVALMVNELVTNALKHAFNGSGANRLDVSVKPDGDIVRIEVHDNGAGINGATGDASFGMKLINALSRQLQATVEWSNSDPGTRVAINLPAEVREPLQ
jgi:PAS domain S-box-containing protein